MNNRSIKETWVFSICFIFGIIFCVYFNMINYIWFFTIFDIFFIALNIVLEITYFNEPFSKSDKKVYSCAYVLMGLIGLSVPNICSTYVLPKVLKWMKNFQCEDIIQIISYIPIILIASPTIYIMLKFFYHIIKPLLKLTFANIQKDLPKD